MNEHIGLQRAQPKSPAAIEAETQQLQQQLLEQGLDQELSRLRSLANDAIQELPSHLRTEFENLLGSHE